MTWRVRLATAPRSPVEVAYSSASDALSSRSNPMNQAMREPDSPTPNPKSVDLNRSPSRSELQYYKHNNILSQFYPAIPLSPR
jgi:hypothetical protein